MPWKWKRNLNNFCAAFTGLSQRWPIAWGPSLTSGGAKYAAQIFVRMQIDGTWQAVTLADLPPELWAKQMARFEEGIAQCGLRQTTSWPLQREIRLNLMREGTA